MDGPKSKCAGLLGAVVTGIVGVVVGFSIGFLSIAVFIPFSDPLGEGRKWLPGIALLFGVGGAFLGGFVGIVAGALFGLRATVKGAATTGILTGLAGAALGFGGGFLLSGLADRQWALLTEGSVNGALLGAYLGMIGGTIFGASQRE